MDSSSMARDEAADLLATAFEKLAKEAAGGDQVFAEPAEGDATRSWASPADGDPLEKRWTMWGCPPTAMHHASDRGDLPTMLRMVADPNERSEWTERFFVSSQTFELAPTRARRSVSKGGLFFRHTQGDSAYGVSAEGFEVMHVYGYELGESDLESAVMKKDVKAVKLALALGLKPTSRHLAIAIHSRKSTDSFSEEAPFHKILEELLLAGADPNGWTSGETPYDFFPCLWIVALNFSDGLQMAKLLVKFGADVNLEAQISTWTGENELDINVQTAAEAAESKGHSEIAAYLKELEDVMPEPLLDAFKVEEHISGLKKHFHGPGVQHE